MMAQADWGFSSPNIRFKPFPHFVTQMLFSCPHIRLKPLPHFVTQMFFEFYDVCPRNVIKIHVSKSHVT